MNTIEMKDFFLQKVKKQKGGGLIVHFQTQEVIDDEIFKTKNKPETTKEAHPDLIVLLDNLKEKIGIIYGWDKLEDSEDFMRKVEVTGVVFNGKDENRSVVITATVELATGQKSALNPRIKFNGQTYGWEEDFLEIAEAIKSEVYEFVYNGKKAESAQLKIDLEDEKAA